MRTRILFLLFFAKVFNTNLFADEPNPYAPPQMSACAAISGQSDAARTIERSSALGTKILNHLEYDGSALTSVRTRAYGTKRDVSIIDVGKLPEKMRDEIDLLGKTLIVPPTGFAYVCKVGVACTLKAIGMVAGIVATVTTGVYLLMAVTDPQQISTELEYSWGTNRQNTILAFSIILPPAVAAFAYIGMLDHRVRRDREGDNMYFLVDGEHAKQSLINQLGELSYNR